jgi:hypothetical protein
MVALAAGGAEQARDQAQHRQEDDRLTHQPTTVKASSLNSAVSRARLLRRTPPVSHVE